MSTFKEKRNPIVEQLDNIAKFINLLNRAYHRKSVGMSLGLSRRAKLTIEPISDNSEE